jgi:hypothetical protein
MGQHPAVAAGAEAGPAHQPVVMVDHSPLGPPEGYLRGDVLASRGTSWAATRPMLAVERRASTRTSGCDDRPETSGE